MKAARHKRIITYEGILIRLSANVSAEILQTRREWDDIFKTLKEKKLPPRILHPEKLSYRNEGDKDFPRSTKAKGICNH